MFYYFICFTSEYNFINIELSEAFLNLDGLTCTGLIRKQSRCIYMGLASEWVKDRRRLTLARSFSD